MYVTSLSVVFHGFIIQDVLVTPSVRNMYDTKDIIFVANGYAVYVHIFLYGTGDISHLNKDFIFTFLR
jgi:hypothetical protein